LLIESLLVTRYDRLTRPTREFASNLTGDAPVYLQVDRVGWKLGSQQHLSNRRTLEMDEIVTRPAASGG
jgi:hypothetical protein